MRMGEHLLQVFLLALNAASSAANVGSDSVLLHAVRIFDAKLGHEKIAITEIARSTQQQSMGIPGIQIRKTTANWCTDRSSVTCSHQNRGTTARTFTVGVLNVARRTSPVNAVLCFPEPRCAVRETATYIRGILFNIL